MSSRKLLLSLAVVAALALPARAASTVGSAFPALAGAGLAGGELPALEGKIVLVDFCASWCAPCKAAFPVLAKLSRDYAGRVVVLGVSIDEKPAAYAAFAKKMAAPFPVLHDRAQSLVRAVEVPTMPTTYIVGRDGKVAAIHAGFHDGAEKELRQLLDAALAAPSSAPTS